MILPFLVLSLLLSSHAEETDAKTSCSNEKLPYTPYYLRNNDLMFFLALLLGISKILTVIFFVTYVSVMMAYTLCKWLYDKYRARTNANTRRFRSGL